MARGLSICYVRKLGVIGMIFLSHVSCDQWFNFGLRKDPCEMECKCYSWMSSNATHTHDRFTVNCTGMKFGFFQGLRIPKALPLNTTDLVVSEYSLGTLSLDSFENNPFPLNPQLISLALRSCHITYISHETFQSNTLQSLQHIDLNSNPIGELHENTFSFLLKLKTISIAHNYIQKVGKRTFRSLRNVQVINISHNWLKELDPETFDNVPSLEVLDLTHNWLHKLPWEKISQLPALKILGLEGNFWNCSCQMSDILKLNRSLLIGTQAKCLNPRRLNGTLLESLTKDKFSHCFTLQRISYPVDIRLIFTIVICIGTVFFYIKYSYLSRNRSETLSDTICIGQIMYNIKDALHPAKAIYRGKLKDGRKAAIKIRPSTAVEKELKFLLHMSEKGRPHPNIIQYLCEEPQSKLTYLALELCCGDLMTAITENIDGFVDIAEPREYLLQLVSGICYIFISNIEHRDIKPQNILWKRSISGVVLVISDFDLSHLTLEESSHKICGTTGWAAPEMQHSGESRPKGKMDIFSLGCVFYFILTKRHPFGLIQDPSECQKNINFPKNKASFVALYEYYNDKCHLATMAEGLLTKMTCYNANDRIEHLELEKHPFFFGKKQLIEFLKTMGEYMENLVDPEVQDFKAKLEENAKEVFDGKWMDKLPRKAQTDLSGFKKNGDKICYLLRAIRNKIEHFGKLKDIELREIYLGDRFGVTQYFLRLFPKLIPYVYKTIKESGLDI